MNTSQTGYQEVCTDPSYAGQVVAMTYPLIGNYGRLRDDDQSERPWLRALVVANATAAVVEQAAQLAALLRDDGIPAIAGVDTRALARHLRTHGSITGHRDRRPGETDPSAAVAAARALPRWEDQDFVDLVSPEAPHEVGGPPTAGPLVAIVDYGLKANIVRSLGRRGARVRVLPHTVAPSPTRWPPTSTGSSCRPARAIRRGSPGRSRWRGRRSPTAGRCSGSASATRSSAAPPGPTRAGCASATTARTTRSGTSTPGRVQVTAQNHEVQVVGETLPRAGGFHVSQRNLNDGSVEGLRHRELPIETVQYHPEGSPGPLDALAVFDRFVAACAPTGRADRRERPRRSRHRPRCSSSAPGRSSSARRPSSTTPAPRPAGRCATRASGRSCSTPTRPRS